MPAKPTSLKSTIDPKHLPLIAEQIVQLYKQRKGNRKELEARWKEIDRQIAMEPEKGHKQTNSGTIIKELEWLPEIELPDQAQTLEVLVGDVMRFIFPKGRDWFRCTAALSNDYFAKFQSVETPTFREKGKFDPLEDGTIDGEVVNRIAQSIPSHFHRQYPFRQNIQLCQAEALKRGFGVGRIRKVNKSIFGHTVKGKPVSQKIPMFIPRKSECVYLDDSMDAVMHEGEIIGPNIVQVFTRRLSDMKAAANNDSSYIKSQLARLVPDKNDCITMIELEGDLVFDTSSEVIVQRNVILTAAFGEDSKKTVFGLIREQEGEGFSTYIVFDYHKESAGSLYATAPLMKGLPIQKLGSQIMNQLVASGQLKITPPVGFNRDDQHFAASGGPVIAPGAQWETTDEVHVYDEVGGDPQIFFAIADGLKARYNDVTGGHAARLGAQTKSHTTAFAKDAELSQGAVRTVDYTDDVLLDPMTRILELEYRMGIENWTKQPVYIEAWDEFLELHKAHLPDTVLFQALGAGAPSEDTAKAQQRNLSIQTAMQVDATAMQMGFREGPRIDYDKVIDKLLEDGGIQDVSQFVREEGEGTASETPPGIITQDPPLLQ